MDAAQTYDLFAFFFFKCSTVVYLYAILNAGTVINDDKLSELVARVLMLV